MGLKTLKIGALVVLLLTGCGGGGGSSTGTDTSSSSSSTSSTGSSSSSAIYGTENSTWETMPQVNNTMAVELKTVNIKKIGLKEIGDSIAHYDLQRGEQSTSELTELGDADANLSNKATPFGVKKTSFYRAEIAFTTNSTYPDGLFFTLSLVSTDKNNPFTKSVFLDNVFVVKSGEQTVHADFLVPDDLPAGMYLLTAKVSNDQLDKIVGEQKSINEIPQIGAVYVDIEDASTARRSYVLDINTTRHIDTPYNKYVYFADNYLQHESGKGRLLFSNVGTDTTVATVSATLRLPNGKIVPLGLLNPETKTIENSVGLIIPAEREIKLVDVTNIINVPSNISDITIAKRARPNPDGSLTPEVEQQLKEVQAVQQHAFIPLAQNKAAKWEKRYSVTLGYYIPEDAYNDVITFSPDITRSISIIPSEGTVEWKVSFSDNHDIQTLANNAKLIKISDELSPTTSLTYDYSHYINLLPKPIDAALKEDSEHAFVFSGDEYTMINPDTGEITGEWKKTTDFYEDATVLLSYPFSAAVHLGNTTYLFYKDKEKYLSHSDISSEGAPKVGLIKDLNPFNMKAYDDDGNVITVGMCLNTHLDVTKIDAAFSDDKDAYFIAGDNYVQFAWNKDEQTYACQYGKVSDKEEWKSASGLPITAALSDYKSKRGRLRFYLNGYKTTVVLNKPDIFKDERNGFDQELGDSDIASLKLDLGYGVQARWHVPGVHGYANADLDLYLFGYPLKLFEAKAEAYGNVGKLHPYLSSNEGSVTAEAKSGMLLHMEMMGNTFVHEEGIATETVEAAIDLDSARQSAARGAREDKDIWDGKIMDWHETYEVFRVPIPAGPVMLSIAGGIDGSMKVGSPIVLHDERASLKESVTVTPTVESGMGAYIQGEVNQAVVKAGVEGDVRVIEAGMNGELKAELDFNSPNTSIDFDVTAKIAGHIRLVKAALGVYVGTRTHIEWCSSWGVPYPCGLGWDTWGIPIYETPWLYNYEPTLLDTTLVDYEIPLM